ncbi:MAG TPA: hypothetical protein VF792_10890 [Ktedonobacterales bacterium]
MDKAAYPHLLSPTRLWSRAEILSSPSPVPRAPGVYAWYFRQIPPQTPLNGCLTHDDLTLLYVGISLKAPPIEGHIRIGQSLRHRMRQHLRGNAEGSTLRLTLGCLLSEQLGIALRRVRSSSSVKGDDAAYRYTFTKEGEARLDAWLERNAYVAWMIDAEPWLVEEELIRSVSLPLNLDQNRHHSFHVTLSAQRKGARVRAQALPVVYE